MAAVTVRRSAVKLAIGSLSVVYTLGVLMSSVLQFDSTQTEVHSNISEHKYHSKLPNRSEFERNTDPESLSTTESTRLPVTYFTYSSTFSLEPNLDLESYHCFVIYVMSAFGEVENRDMIRNTWANRSNIKAFKGHGFNVQTFFVIGGLQFEEKSMQLRVREEHQKYGDVLSVDGLEDDYNSLTEKTIYALNYVYRTFDLERLDFIFKVDSDNFINIYIYLSLAWNYQLSRTPIPDFICFIFPERDVIRWGKYREPKYRYSPNKYPQHCSGPAYVTSRQMVGRLVNASYSVPMMQSEDVMLTGIGIQGGKPAVFHEIKWEEVFFERVAFQKAKRHNPNVVEQMPWMFYAHDLRKRYWTIGNQLLIQHFL